MLFLVKEIDNINSNFRMFFHGFCAFLGIGLRLFLFKKIDNINSNFRMFFPGFCASWFLQNSFCETVHIYLFFRRCYQIQTMAYLIGQCRH